MAKLIHEQINITVDPYVRIIMRKNKIKHDEPLEVADIQLVIKALSNQCQRQSDRINYLQGVIKSKKNKLKELDLKIKEYKSRAGYENE